MSWSMAAIGRNKPVAESLAAQSLSYKCQEPEESVRRKVVESIILIAESNPDGFMEVSASGSMSYTKVGTDGKTPLNPQHHVKLSIKALDNVIGVE